jgi:hypothetical protein
MIDIRLRSKISEQELEQKIGKILTDEDYNLLVTKDTTIRGINGELVAVYQKGIIPETVVDKTYPTLHDLRRQQTNNRGNASGVPRIKRRIGNRTDTVKSVASAIVGSMDAVGPFQYCRLTAYSGKETAKYKELFPLFEFIGNEMAKVAPERYKAQMERVENTHADWVIPNTPFTTITVNNSYPTGVHTDKGDLDEGISTLAVIKKGKINGGYLVLPEYRVAFKMEHGDLLIFNAHEWHGNTELEKETEDGERISVVCYYRTAMEKCESMDIENQKKIDYGQRRLTNDNI